MNFVSVFMAVFSMIGAVDLLLGNRFKLGQEFEKGFQLLGRMALSMIGMIVIAPLIGRILTPALDTLHTALGLESSVFPAMLLANDMGGAPLSDAVATDAALGRFNGLVVSSMMGCTISFTIPVVLGMVKKEQHSSILLGLLCGIVTVPVGCFVSGLMLKLPIPLLLLDLLPLLVFSGLIACGLIFIPKVCVRIFGILGKGIQILVTLGLMLGLLRFMTGVEIIPGLDTYENGAMICFNAAAVMSGAFPFLHLLSKALTRPLHALGRKLGISEQAALGLLSSTATSVTTFEAMNSMEHRGVVLNAAFAVSAGFTFAGHLGFTLAYNGAYVIPVIVGKLISGLCALMAAMLLTKRQKAA